MGLTDDLQDHFPTYSDFDSPGFVMKPRDSLVNQLSSDQDVCTSTQFGAEWDGSAEQATSANSLERPDILRAVTKRALPDIKGGLPAHMGIVHGGTVSRQRATKKGTDVFGFQQPLTHDVEPTPAKVARSQPLFDGRSSAFDAVQTSSHPRQVRKTTHTKNKLVWKSI